MTLAESVTLEIKALEGELAGDGFDALTGSPFGLGLSMLLSAGRRKPESFYGQMKGVRDLLDQALSNIEARL